MPFILVAIIISAIVNRGRIWFIQERIGQHSRPFKLYKFKTLTEEEGRFLKHEKVKDVMLDKTFYITVWGKFLRKSGLDELPQFLNIIKNELTFVGPRPLLPEYQIYYSENELKRHHVKPGITGLAQVSGGNALNWDERLNQDVFYVENISFSLDCKILLKTLVGFNSQNKTFPANSLIDDRIN